MKFIRIPNLPEADAALAAVSGTYPALIDALHAFNIDTIPIRCCQRLSKPVASHADMLLHHLGDNRVVVADGETYLTEKLQRYGFAVTHSNICISNAYPNDIVLNAARVGNYLFAKSTELDPAIGCHCMEKHIEIIPAKQGYAKCSTAVVNRDSIITEDPSISEAAKKKGIDVLTITPGHVRLEGYNYGFLGGTCGLIGKNKLAFFGNIQTHPDYEKIRNFCVSKNVTLISLTDGPLIDVGGILPLKIKSELGEANT